VQSTGLGGPKQMTRARSGAPADGFLRRGSTYQCLPKVEPRAQKPTHRESLLAGSTPDGAAHMYLAVWQKDSTCWPSTRRADRSKLGHEAGRSLQKALLGRASETMSKLLLGGDVWTTKARILLDKSGEAFSGTHRGTRWARSKLIWTTWLFKTIQSDAYKAETGTPRRNR
jgi:hypothetical protein